MKKKIKTDREVYVDNRDNMLIDFDNYLEEVQQDKPSIGGEIAGMNFQQFSGRMVFSSIKEQEEYIEYTKRYKPKYVILKEEEKILKEMIKKAKKVFGKEYKQWYADASRG